jgi:ATP-dependent helicase Lhr and Lhr-like helicase
MSARQRAPSRLAQRIGRAHHRLDEPSKALLVPANRFEVVECQAALEAAEEGAQDTPPSRPGALDVLSQHVLGTACAGPFDPHRLYREVVSASPYQGLTREGFDKVVEFVTTGGYALANYERYAKLKRTPDGRYRVAHPRIDQLYRLNMGTIVEAPMVRVRLARLKGGALKPASMLVPGRVLGEVEEYFIEQLMPGDSFVFAGEILRFEGLRELDAIVTRAHTTEPKVPSYEGGKFPLSTYLAERVRLLLAEPESWSRLPDQVSDWLRFQADVSVVPSSDEILVETFPRGKRHCLVCYPFEGRLAHQSLGMLLARRLERAGAAPLGFVATNMRSPSGGSTTWARWCEPGVSTSPSCSKRICSATTSMRWLACSSLMKRSFRVCAIISGLIERRHPGQGEDRTADDGVFRSDLRRAPPARTRPHSSARRICRCSNGTHRCRPPQPILATHSRTNQAYCLEPSFAARLPVMLEIGRESVPGEASETLLRETAEELIAEALSGYAQGKV